MEEQKLKAMLLELAAKRPGLRRKQLIEACVDQLDFRAEELRDHSVSSPVIREKSRIGAILTALIENGDIGETESGRLTVQRGIAALRRQEETERLVLRCLAGGETWQKAQLFAEADRTMQGPDVHPEVGQAIARLLREKRILEVPDGYLLRPASHYPNTELGNWLLEARNGGDLKNCFLSAIHVRGGEWFEAYAVRLLAEYYRQCGNTVTRAAVTGGSDDGGLDGVIETTDWLGFREKTLLQMKNRSVVIAPKDIREFYGAVCAEHGTRGVFITISTFHLEAQRLLDKVDNLIGVDGDKLLAIAKLCRFGILDRDGRLTLDDDLFLENVEPDPE
ncbi:MAG: restriction endonuclease [Oscillospiraceae bacterium]|nr:restriction endonuclease [Oscillospiraceae bacterium]